MKKLAWGRLLAADRRDRKFGVQLKQSDLKRKMWKDTNWEGDQGRTSQCVGFAWAHWLDASPIRQFAKPDGIYALAQFVDEWEGEQYDGTSVRAGAKVLQKLGFIGQYQWASTVGQIVEAIVQVGPVVVGTDWLQGMLKTDASGYVSATGQILGGHAYLLSGVDRISEFFRLKNSWGTNWGVKGRAKIRFDDFASLLARRGEACLGVEARPRPGR